MVETRTQLKTKCPFCGEPQAVMVNMDDYTAWKEGKLIQNAMPYLSTQERELVMTGICSKCWAETFGDDDE